MYLHTAILWCFPLLCSVNSTYFHEIRSSAQSHWLSIVFRARIILCRAYTSFFSSFTRLFDDSLLTETSFSLSYGWCDRIDYRCHWIFHGLTWSKFDLFERFLCCPYNSNFVVNLLTYDFAVNMHPSSQRIAFAADFSAVAQQNPLLMWRSFDNFFATL